MQVLHPLFYLEHYLKFFRGVSDCFQVFQILASNHDIGISSRGKRQVFFFNIFALSFLY